jgi:hypothetical protein
LCSGCRLFSFLDFYSGLNVPRNAIVIHVSGGLVQAVYCSLPEVEITLVDFDVDGSYRGEPGIVEFVSAGRAEQVFVSELPASNFDELAGTDVEQAVQAAGVLV